MSEYVMCVTCGKPRISEGGGFRMGVDGLRASGICWRTVEDDAALVGCDAVMQREMDTREDENDAIEAERDALRAKLAEAMKVVEAVAALPKPAVTAEEDGYCLLCGDPMNDHDRPDCPWLAARALLAIRHSLQAGAEDTCHRCTPVLEETT